MADVAGTALQKVYTLLPQLLNAAEKTAYAMSDRLQGDGVALLTLLTVIVVSWSAIKTLLEQGQMTDTLSELIRALMMWGFASWLLTTYQDTTQYILLSFDAIATKLTVGQTALNNLKSVSDFGNTVVNGYQSGGGDPLYVGLAGFFDAANTLIGALMNLQSQLGWLQFIAQFQSIISGVLILFATVMIQIICAAIYFVVYASSKLLICIGLALGPVFIPWFVFEPTRSLFDGWLRFLVQASLYKVVAAVLVMLVAPMIATLMQFVGDIYAPASAGQNSGVSAFVGFNMSFVAGSMAICLLSILIAVLMLSAPMIASALAGGKLVAGGRLPLPKGPSVSGSASKSSAGSHGASTANTKPVSGPNWT